MNTNTDKSKLSFFDISCQNFKREEQNFVVQNEINNLSFLTGDNKTKMSKVGFVFSHKLNFMSLFRQQVKTFLVL